MNLSRLQEIALELPDFEIPSSLDEKKQWGAQFTNAKFDMPKKSYTVTK